MRLHLLRTPGILPRNHRPAEPCLAIRRWNETSLNVVLSPLLVAELSLDFEVFTAPSDELSSGLLLVNKPLDLLFVGEFVVLKFLLVGDLHESPVFLLSVQLSLLLKLSIFWNGGGVILRLVVWVYRIFAYLIGLLMVEGILLDDDVSLFNFDVLEVLHVALELGVQGLLQPRDVGGWRGKGVD